MSIAFRCQLLARWQCYKRGKQYSFQRKISRPIAGGWGMSYLCFISLKALLLPDLSKFFKADSSTERLNSGHLVLPTTKALAVLNWVTNQLQELFLLFKEVMNHDLEAQDTGTASHHISPAYHTYSSSIHACGRGWGGPSVALSAAGDTKLLRNWEVANIKSGPCVPCTIVWNHLISGFRADCGLRTDLKFEAVSVNPEYNTVGPG